MSESIMFKLSWVKRNVFREKEKVAFKSEFNVKYSLYLLYFSPHIIFAFFSFLSVFMAYEHMCKHVCGGSEENLLVFCCCCC